MEIKRDFPFYFSGLLFLNSECPLPQQFAWAVREMPINENQ